MFPSLINAIVFFFWLSLLSQLCPPGWTVTWVTRTSIVYEHIFIILDNSSTCFRYWIESHLFNIRMHIDTHLLESVLKKLKLRMSGVNSDVISQNLTHLPIPRFKTIFYQTRSIMPTGINSTSRSSSRFFPRLKQ